MARQTVIRHFVFRMAIHTPIHGHLHPRLRRGFFTLANISMTGRTGYLSQNGMTAMRKEDVVRLFIYPSPRNVLSLFLKLSDLFFLRGLGNGFFMAFKAGG